jgi:hypothetical protein
VARKKRARKKVEEPVAVEKTPTPAGSTVSGPPPQEALPKRMWWPLRLLLGTLAATISFACLLIVLWVLEILRASA